MIYHNQNCNVLNNQKTGGVNVMKLTVKLLCVTCMILIFSATMAYAKPGPVVVNLMERLEMHSDTTSSQGDISGETYSYSMLSLFRKLDTDVFGNIFYIHKYSVNDGDTAGNIGGVSVTRKYTKNTSANFSYSYNSNPQRNVVPSSDTDRFAISGDYTLNPKSKGAVHTLTTTYSTGTDFSFGRTIAEKLACRRNVTKRADAIVAYQYVYGLNNSEQFTNQYSFDLTYKLNKTAKIALGALYIDNVYTGATTDDSIIRISYLQTLEKLGGK